MNAYSHDVKFTASVEREMIQREIDDTNDPLLKWILAFAISVGTLFIVLFNGQ